VPDGYLHAKGTQPLLPAGHAELKHTNYFQTGMPSIICGALGLPSYLITGDTNAHLSHFGVNHGPGKGHLLQPSASSNQTQKQLMESIFTNRPDRKTYGTSLRQRSSNLQNAIDSLHSRQILKLKAQLRPLLNFSGDTKAPIVLSKKGKDLLIG
jgi:RNA-splicing ligase RtcB